MKIKYLFFYLLSIQPQIELLANGSVQQNLSKDILAEYEIQVPKDYNTMNQIVWILKNIDKKEKIRQGFFGCFHIVCGWHISCINGQRSVCGH